MPALNQTEQQHMLNMYGVVFAFRCDACRQGIKDVLNGYKARVLGGATICKECAPTTKLKENDTVEFIPKENRPSFLGKRNNPDVPESWTHCGDCNAPLRPTEHNLASAYIVTVNRHRKAVCHNCYTTKYESAAPKRSAAPAAASSSADISKMERKVLDAITSEPKKKWNVGVLFEALSNESKPLIREAVRSMKRSGVLFVEDHALKVRKKKVN